LLVGLEELEIMARKIMVVVTTGLLLASVAACNTVRGAGDDLNSAANEVEKEI
jgi:predicted small secreted protein